MSKKPHHTILSAPEFETVMRALAEAGQVAPTSHARFRMRKRGFSEADVIRCFLKGRITEGPFTNEFGNQQATVERFMCGEEITVVVAIEKEMLIVRTVID